MPDQTTTPNKDNQAELPPPPEWLTRPDEGQKPRAKGKSRTRNAKDQPASPSLKERADATPLVGEIQPPAESGAAPPTPEELEEIAADLRARYRRVQEEVLAIGSILLRAKASFPKGGFLAWVEREVGMQPRMAQMAMQVTQAFSPEDRIVRLFPGIGHLVELARAPEEVREKAVEMREAGERVTVPLLQKMRAAHAAAARPEEEDPQRDVLGPALRPLLQAHLAPVQRKILRAYDNLRKQVANRAEEARRRLDKEATNPYPRTWAITIGESARQLRRLLETHAGVYNEADNGAGENVWHRIHRTLERLEEQGILAENGTAPPVQALFDALGELPQRPKS